MTEPVERAAPPLRTWRPMALGTAGILLVLGLVWFVTAVVVPTVGTHRVLRELASSRDTPQSWPTWDGRAEIVALERLGGAEKAFRRLKIYRALPPRIAPHRAAALRLIGLCGVRALPLMREALASHDGTEVLLALATLQEKFWCRAELAALAPALTRLLDVDRTEEPWPEVPRMAERIIAWTGPANVVFHAEGEAAEILDSKLVRVETAAGLESYPLGFSPSEDGVGTYPRDISGGKALHFECMMNEPKADKRLARLRLAVPEDGNYYIFLRGDAWCCGCQVLEFRIDDGAKLTASELWFDSLDWRSLIQGRRAKDPGDVMAQDPEPVRLSAGEHSLTITRAEPICGGMIIDELAVVRSSRAAADSAMKKLGGEEPPK